MIDKTHEEIVKGDEAKRILENPVYKDALESVRKSLVDAMSNSAIGDERTHNRLVIALQMLNQIERSLKTVMETGKMASIQVTGGAVHKLRGIA